MAEIISEKTGEKIEIDDGEELRPACENLSVPFGCRDGHCGTCLIEVLDGEENLSELTEKEEELYLDKKNRLACQTKIKKGKVKITW